MLTAVTEQSKVANGLIIPTLFGMILIAVVEDGLLTGFVRFACERNLSCLRCYNYGLEYFRSAKIVHLVTGTGI